MVGAIENTAVWEWEFVCTGYEDLRLHVLSVV